MSVFDASGVLFTLALRDEAPGPSPARPSTLGILIAVAAALCTRSGRVRRRLRRSGRGRPDARVPVAAPLAQARERS